MKKIQLKHIQLCVFFIVLFAAAFLNGKGLIQSVQALVSGEKSVQTVFRELPDTLKENFMYKDEFTNLYGFTQKLLGKRVVGNFEFMKDEEGELHLFHSVSGDDQELFAKELIALNTLCGQNNDKLLYVQMPPRIMGDQQTIAGYSPNNENETMNYLEKQMEAAGVEYYDYFSSIIESGLIEEDQIYFKTDAHMTTAAELVLLEELVSYLENQYGLEFCNKEIVLNWENYELDSRAFLGNFARSSGKYYAGTDRFDMYVPMFQTHLRTTVQDGQVLKEGDFKHAIMNGYEDAPDADCYTYWVTNYGQFTRDVYQFENLELSDGPNILLVMDSNGYRTASYLSLMCSRVTIVDPRYDSNGYGLSSLIQDFDYDAVIVMQGTSLCGSKLVYDESALNAEIISYAAHSDASNTIQITVQNTGMQSWRKEEQIRLCIWKDGADKGYRLDLPDDVVIAPGEEYTFTLALQRFILPEADDTLLELQMLREGQVYFGEREPLQGIVEELGIAVTYEEQAAYYAAVFDADYYANAYPDLVEAFGNDKTALLNHFLECGMAECRQGSAEFNVYVYMENYPDLCDAYGEDVVAYYYHYIDCGKNEERNAVVLLHTE